MASAPYVVLFPLPAQGHLNPFNWLAQYLVSSGLSVTFVHSARSFRLLSNRTDSPAFLPSSNPRFEVVPDVLPADDKTNLSREALFASFPLMEQGLDEVLQKLTMEYGTSPSCIVTDNFLPWTQAVADKHGIPRIELCTMSASALAMILRIPELYEKGYLPLQSGAETKMVDLIPGLRPFRLDIFPSTLSKLEPASPALDLFCSVSAHVRKVSRVLLNSFYDLESEVIDALRAQRIPIDPIGPLISLGNDESTKTRSPGSLLPEDATCLDWLDSRQNSSVLYIAFGSIAKFDDETLQELALGLESSQQSFLWVIRPDVVKGSLDELLPEGFQDRTRERGLIISWAPQLAVLSHPAVGGFLSHCGWNSTMESLFMGVPIIGFPLRGEQNTNLHYIIEWEVGMGLQNQQAESGVKCERGEVERVIREMMQGETGSETRRRAAEWGKAARKAREEGSSRVNLETLVADIKGGLLKASTVS